nr:MAG TPA: hypothetical protein [Caudoviricetes sp.]DAX34686.1 MAG TPA: hypothetical protein [Caudoviricetes sp.]
MVLLMMMVMYPGNNRVGLLLWIHRHYFPYFYLL